MSPMRAMTIIGSEAIIDPAPWNTLKIDSRDIHTPCNFVNKLTRWMITYQYVLWVYIVLFANDDFFNHRSLLIITIKAAEASVSCRWLSAVPHARATGGLQHREKER